MTALYWVIGILAVLIVPTLFKVKLEILYAGKATLYIKYLFFKIKIPPDPNPKKEARRAEKEKKRKSKKKGESKKKKQMPQDEKGFREKIHGFIVLLDDLFGFSKRLMRYMHQRLTCETLECVIEVGTGNAATTAISVGGLWSFLYTSYAALTRYFAMQFDQPSFSVTPDYNRKLFDFQFHGIFSVRVVNIIIIGMWSSVHFLKRIFTQAFQNRAESEKQAESVEK